MNTAISATDAAMDRADRLEARLDRVDAAAARRGSSRRVARGDHELRLVNGKRTFVLQECPTRDYALVKLQHRLRLQLARAKVALLVASSIELAGEPEQIAA